MDTFLGLLAPHTCLVCGEEGAVICAWCLSDAAPPLPSRCYMCKAATRDSRTCPACRRKSSLRHVWVRTVYDGTAKQLVHDFKFERKRAAAQPISVMMEEVLPFQYATTIVTHVPTATGRARQRGYDQAELLARALAGQLGLRHETLLLRATQTRQVGSRRSERLKQMEKAFAPRGSKALRSAQVLLVDDLTTTGATLESAARCLKKQGVKVINAVVFAQK